MMMKTLDCNDHGRLVHDLALGRLSDDAAMAAEEALRLCPTCQQWWSEQLVGAAAAAVDREVGQVFASFAPPRRSRRRVWLAAAAALALACGVAAMWFAGGSASSPQLAHQLGPADDAPQAIFASNLEDGDLGGWSISAERPGVRLAAVASPAPETQAAPAGGPPNIFGDDLESGDLSSWL